jgi:hypothetical protein
MVAAQAAQKGPSGPFFFFKYAVSGRVMVKTDHSLLYGPKK